MTKNQLLIYKDKNTLFPALYIEEKNGRYRIQNRAGKIFYIHMSDIIISSTTINSFEMLDAASSKITISPEELWETIHELGDEIEFEELVELAFGDNDLVTAYTLHELIMNNEIYFKLQYPNVLISSEEQVDIQKKELILLAEEMSQKEAKLNEARTKIIELLKTNSKLLEYDETVAQLLSPIREYALQGDDFSGKTKAIELFQNLYEQAGLKKIKPDYTRILQFTFDAQLFKSYDEFLLRKFGLKTSHSTSEEISTPINCARVDLTTIETITIDNETTVDMDDALSLAETESTYEVYIHISDVDALIPKDSEHDKEAFKKGTSLYLVTERHSLFPRIDSFQALSLIENQTKPVITLKVVFNKSDFSIIKKEFMLAHIRVDKKLHYMEADAIINDNTSPLHKTLTILQQCSSALRDKRIANDALIIDNPDIEIFFENGKTQYRVILASSNSKIIISEFMIFYNHNIADFCFHNQIPCIYITQEAPSQNLKGKRSGFSRPELQKVFPLLKKSVMGLTPAQHFCMGLSYYSQATSPIRRYADLLLQRNIKNFLLNQNHLYTEDELRILLATIQPKITQANQAERESLHYWLRRYIEENIDKEYTGFITRTVQGGALCELDDLFMRIQITGNEKYEVGKKISIRFKKMNALLNKYVANGSSLLDGE